MRLGKRQQARRITPPPVQEALPPPRQPMVSFPTGPYEMPPPGYAPDGSPTMGYGPDGMPWMGPGPDGPPLGFAPDGSPTLGYAPDGSPTMGYAPDGSPTMGYAPEGVPPPYPPEGTAAYGYGPDGMPWMGSGPDGFPPMAYAYAPDGTPLLYGTDGPPPGYPMDGPAGGYAPDLPPMGYPPPQPPFDQPAGFGQGPEQVGAWGGTAAHEAQAAYQPQAPEPQAAFEAQASFEAQAAFEAQVAFEAQASSAVGHPVAEPLAVDEPPIAPPPLADRTRVPITPESPQVSWEPEPEGQTLPDDAIPWPDFAPINRLADDADVGEAGVERLPTATQAHRLRLDRPIESTATTRSAEARLARLHLRGGMLGLARASLEQLAGVGTLDREALADLAETRWRNGDLEGAAEAAEAHLQARGDEPIARVVAAEWSAHDGRILDARQLATQVQGQLGEGLERLFADEPRSAVWPPAVPGWMDVDATTGGRFGLLVGGGEVADADAETWLTAPLAGADDPRLVPASSVLLHTGQHAPAIHVPGGIESAHDADRELHAAEGDLARGDLASLADRLGLLLRRDPGLAPVILSLTDRALAAGAERLGGQPTSTSGAASVPVPGLASLQMLRGDILRGLGHETDATQAYQQALRALPGRATTREST